jgi:hypothetical protein
MDFVHLRNRRLAFYALDLFLLLGELRMIEPKFPFRQFFDFRFGVNASRFFNFPYPAAARFLRSARSLCFRQPSTFRDPLCSLQPPVTKSPGGRKVFLDAQLMIGNHVAILFINECICTNCPGVAAMPDLMHSLISSEGNAP